MLAVARESVREGAAHGDDAIRSRHLQLEVGVARDCHEFGIAWPPQDGVVGPRKVYHFEGEDLRVEVGLAAECDGQIDLSERVCLRSQDYLVEGGARQADLRSGDVHGIEGVDVEDVEAVASVH